MSYPHTRLFIAGTWQDAADGKTIDVTNPATGKVVDTVPAATAADVARAVDEAVKGQKVWPRCRLRKK